MDVPTNSIFSGPVIQLLSVMCILMKILSHASVKKKRKGLRISNFTLLFVVFKRHQIVAVKGLSEKKALTLTKSKNKRNKKTETLHICRLYKLNIYEHEPECAQVKWDIWMKNQMLNYI